MLLNQNKPKSCITFKRVLSKRDHFHPRAGILWSASRWFLIKSTAGWIKPEIMTYMDYGRGYDHVEDDDSNERDLNLNIVIMVVTMLMIALVTIGAISKTDSSKQGAGTLKTLMSICRITEEPESCVHVLKDVGETATVLAYVKGGINATIIELKLVVNVPKFDLETKLNPLQTQSYEDCMQLLKLAKEELNSTYTMLNMLSAMSGTKSIDVLNSLSAVVSYQQACSDELMRTNSFGFLGFSLKMPILHTRITLAIVDNFAEKPSSSDSENHRTGGQDDQLDGYSAGFPGADVKVTDHKKNGDIEVINAVVAQDGSGHFSTISESLNACKKNGGSPCVVYVKTGKYEERVVVPKDVGQVTMYGDGPMNTIVTGINTRDLKMLPTPFRAATFVVMGKGFICRNMGFTAPANITGAPALLVLSDHAAFFNCKIDGEEGSLHAMAQRQFYRDCEIHGSVDIIKGDSATVIQNSQIIIKARNSSDLVLRRNVVSAQSRSYKYERTGLVIQNCTITAQDESGNSSLAATTYLGTPYSEHSRTIIMESFLGNVIHPKGWCKWSDNYGLETAIFREYNNRGPGANIMKRVRWDSFETVFERKQMTSFLAAEFIQPDQWLQNAAIPYESGFIYK